MLQKSLLTIASLGLFSQLAVAGGDAEKGKARATICMTCHGHGPDGKPKNKDSKDIYGKDEAYIVEKLKGYKTKTIKSKTAAIMYPMAGSLDDATMANIAAYFKSLK